VWEKSAKALEVPLAKALPLTKALEILRPPPKALWAVIAFNTLLLALRKPAERRAALQLIKFTFRNF
jgi:hypothetical protein